ncbi:MAG: hypothetical protein R3222_05430 [Balneolaceae bacterium]|nr:hypothetical protein [Balneolaceae bacterium]
MPKLVNIGFLARCLDEGSQEHIHPITDAAIVWEKDKIVWVGRESDLPEEYDDEPSYDADQAMVTPGLVDCHTHLAFGGWRAFDFDMRL